jgi:hypothetical protein
VERPLGLKSATGGLGSIAGAHERPLTGTQFFGYIRISQPMKRVNA